MAKRVNVTFTDQAYETLTRIADTRGKSISDVLRDALALEEYVVEARQEGGRLLIERPGQDTRELLTR